MEKEFIPYEQALELKQLGFNEPCFGYYNYDGSHFFKYKPKTDDKNLTIAPLYQQAFRWFREKYDLEPHTKKDWSDGVCWGYESIIECVDGIIDCGTFKTYEEAELECLIKLIELTNK